MIVSASRGDPTRTTRMTSKEHNTQDEKINDVHSFRGDPNGLLLKRSIPKRTRLIGTQSTSIKRSISAKDESEIQGRTTDIIENTSGIYEGYVR